MKKVSTVFVALMVVVEVSVVSLGLLSSNGEKPNDKDDLYPIVINTWPFNAATERAWDVISAAPPNDPSTTFARDAIEQGCQICEIIPCASSIGFGGSPDTTGETTLDAMIMDGTSFEVGAVGDLRMIKNAIGVARRVMENTQHTLLAGSRAADFAEEMGISKSNLSTPQSIQQYEDWKQNNCQPGYYKNVSPNSTASCGPFTPLGVADSKGGGTTKKQQENLQINEDNHDTIAMIVVDKYKNVVSGTTTNGANHKIAGRIGDSPIMGAGSYADSEVGGCGETGDGDTMMRFLPCFYVIELMRGGMSATNACETAIRRIMRFYPNFVGAIVAVNINGDHGAAGHGWTFVYNIRTPSTGGVVSISVPPIN